jgi:hypothetical protein
MSRVKVIVFSIIFFVFGAIFYGVLFKWRLYAALALCGGRDLCVLNLSIIYPEAWERIVFWEGAKGSLQVSGYINRFERDEIYRACDVMSFVSVKGDVENEYFFNCSFDNRRGKYIEFSGGGKKISNNNIFFMESDFFVVEKSNPFLCLKLINKNGDFLENSYRIQPC